MGAKTAALVLVVIAAGGCASTGRTAARGDKPAPADAKPAGPKALLSWEAGEKPADDGDEAAKDDDKDDRIVTDRPDFTEASSTVGKGRVQLESGYTFSRDRADGARVDSHSYPEALLRVGLFADWFEFRVGQNVSSTITTGATTPGTNQAGHVTGFEDLYLGVKLALTEQKGALPETGVILQMTVPSGRRELTAGRVLPGLSYLYTWDVIPDKISVAGNTLGNLAVDGDDHTYLELAQSLSVGYTLTDKLGAYTEWFALFPSGATASGVGPEYYFDGGFTYLVTRDFQLDVRGGVGLNKQADDYFVGTGFAVRY